VCEDVWDNDFRESDMLLSVLYCILRQPLRHGLLYKISGRVVGSYYFQKTIIMLRASMSVNDNIVMMISGKIEMLRKA